MQASIRRNSESTLTEMLCTGMPILRRRSPGTSITGSLSHVSPLKLQLCTNSCFLPFAWSVPDFRCWRWSTIDSPAVPQDFQWFWMMEISGGGKTELPNLRIVQWQAYARKRNRLEFLVPWWDLQHGCSINQFLSAFAAKNADFRFLRRFFEALPRKLVFQNSNLFLFQSGRR